MTTGNVKQARYAWTDIAGPPLGRFAAGTYYFPMTGYVSPATVYGDQYIDMDGFDHLSILIRLTAGAADTLTATVESDDGTTATFEWDDSLGSYDSTTNTYNASYAVTNGTIRAHLHLDDCNGKRFRLKLVVVGGASNAGVVTFRKTKK